MTRYDKIYVPGHDGSNDAVSLEATRKTVYKPKSTISMPINTIMLQERGPVICMTIEELINLWNTAKEYGSDVANAVRKGDPDLISAIGMHDYLKSKEITI